MTKQTSGKWVVRQEGIDHIYWRVYDSNGQVIINTAFDKEIAEQIVRDHNTAPGLLEALEDARDFIMRFDEVEPEEIEMSKEISDVIDKARKGE